MAKKSSAKLAAGLGAAALAAATSAAAGYYFFGEGSKKRKAQLKSWSHKAKTEMQKQIKGMRQVSKKSYEQAVRDVMAKYKQAKNIDPKELAAFGAELKGHWDEISKSAAKITAKPAGARAQKAGTRSAGKARR